MAQAGVPFNAQGKPVLLTQISAAPDAESALGLRPMSLPVEPTNVAPVTLEGRHVRLEPLSHAHHADLCAIGLEPELWRLIPTQVRTPDEMVGVHSDGARRRSLKRKWGF